jgi:hypothetical protein
MSAERVFFFTELKEVQHSHSRSIVKSSFPSSCWQATILAYSASYLIISQSAQSPFNFEEARQSFMVFATAPQTMSSRAVLPVIPQLTRHNASRASLALDPLALG